MSRFLLNLRQVSRGTEIQTTQSFVDEARFAAHPGSNGRSLPHFIASLGEPMRGSPMTPEGTALGFEEELADSGEPADNGEKRADDI